MKNKGLISRLFYNDKALLVVALLAATIIWLYIAVEKNVPTTKTFYDMNVTADGASIIEEKYGLQCYGLDNVQPSVVINGQRYILGEKNFKDNIIVSVDVSKVSDVGEYTLPVEVDIDGDDTTSTVSSVSPDYINVFFDKPTEKTFEVTPEPETDITTDSGYVAGEPYASVEKITFSGPSTEIKKIDSVVVKFSPDRSLSENTTYSNLEYEVVTIDGSILTYSKSDFTDNIEVTVPVYKSKTFVTEADFGDAPDGFEENVSVTITPSIVNGGVYDKVGDVDTFKIPVDYTEIQPGVNTINVSAEDVKAANNGCIIVDDVEEFTVTVTADNFSQKVITVGNNIHVTGGEYKTVTANVKYVTIMGPTSAVSSYDVDNLALYADITSVDVEKGSVVVELKLEDGSKCWLINSPTATVTIE